MAKVLSESAAANIRKTIDDVTANKTGIPGCVAPQQVEVAHTNQQPG